MDPPRHTLSPIHTTFSGPTGTLARSQKQQQQQYQQTSRGSTAGAGNDRHSPHDHAYALSQSHAGGQSYGRNHAHPLDSHIDYPTSSSASAGPSRSPSAAYNLPPLHSITQPYPPFPPSPVGRRHSPAPLPLPPPPPLPSTLPPLPAPSVSAPDSPGSVNGGGGGGAAETGTPSSASATKKRRRPAKTDVSATAESLGIRQTQRVPLSCRECSRRKIKCDKAVPCRPCIERGEEAICKREAVMVKGKIVANEPLRANATLESLAQENLEIRNRVDRLERLIGRQSPDRAIKNEEALEFKEHRLAGVMEEVALGIGENVRWKGVSLGPNPDSTAPSKDQWYHSVPFETCLSTIPNRVKSEALVQFFADELYWIDGVVHVPTFLRQHNTFWAKSDQGRVDDDNWLALYFAVLSLSGYFMEADHAQLNGFQVNELSRLAKVWFDCSIAILMRNNFMGAAAFVALQAVQVLRYPFHLSGNTGIHSSMFLVGVRHAMAMNLHLVGGGYGESQEEKLAREMARRVWWGCVEPDWHFLPYLRYGHLSPHQFTTAMPDLTDDLEPLSESYDPLHFRLAMYRSARVLYRLFGNLSPFEDPRYEAVLAASEDMDVVTARLPPELQMSGERQHTSSSIACVRRFVQMTLAHRMYLVHRAYYIKSFRDATYAPSHTACIQAATDIINLAERGLPAPFYRLWNTTVWLVAAGIILSLDLVQAADAKREVTDATARRATLGNLVELLYNSGDVNVGIASRGAALIVHLGRAEQEIIAGSRQGAKMTREDILELISRSEAMPTPLSGPHAHDSDTSVGIGGIRSVSGGGGGGGGSATTGASAAGSSSRMQPPGSAHLPSKPFTPPASHRSGSMHSQSLPADSPTVYHNAAYPSGTPVQGSSSSMGGSGGGGGGPGADPPGSSSGYGPGGGMHGAAPGMLNPGMQWGGMLDLGMGMGISPGLPAVGPVAGHVPGPGLGMGMGMGGVGMGGGMGMGGMSGSGMGMGMGPGYSGGNGSNHANISMTPDMNGSTGGAMHMQGHGQGQQHQHQHPHQYPGMAPDGTYPVAGQMPMTGEWILPENNALMGFIDELFPPGR